MTRSERIYRSLLKAYPKRYLERYEEPMAQLFSDQLRDVLGAGPLVLLWLRTLVDLLRTIPARHFDRLRGRGRYVPTAARTLFFARYTAIGLGHGDITAEDIQAGLLREAPEIAALFSSEALVEIRQEIGFARTPIRKTVPLHLPLSDAAKQVLAEATHEADRAGAEKITALHLAAGILIQGHTFAADLLRRNGISLDRLRTPRQ
jgi:hypothetical protein